jgi:hypothetical protein
VMLPEPDVNVTVPAVKVPLELLIFPLPFAVNDIEPVELEPVVTFAPIAMLPFVPDCNTTVPDEPTVTVVAILAPAACVMLPALVVASVSPPLAVVVYAPPNDMFPPLLPALLDRVTASDEPNVTLLVLATVILPAVPPPTPVFTFNTLGSLAKYNVPLPFATCRSLFIVTFVLPRFNVSPEEPEAVTVLDDDVDVIVPVPVAVIVTLVPLTTPPSEMLELVPLITKLIAPEEVNPAEPIVSPVPEDALSVNVIEAGLLVTL